MERSPGERARRDRRWRLKIGTYVTEKLGANRAVLALSLARLGDGIGNSILIVVIPIYVAKVPAPWFPFPDSVLVGALIALFGIVNFVVQPLAGAWSDRTGRRKVFIQGGLLLMGGATFAYLFVDRYAELVLVRALQGVGFAFTITASLAIMTRVTERDTRGGAMGVFTTFRMIGFAIGPLVGGFLQSRYGFPPAFWTGAGFILLAVLFVHLWVEDPEEGEPAEKPRKFRIVDPSLLSPPLLSLGLATFVMAAGISMMSALENAFNARLDQSAFAFGVAFSALIASRIVFQIPLGRLSDRIGRRPVVLVGLVALAPATAAIGLSSTTWELVLFRLLQGVASAAVAAPAFALAADLSRRGGEGRQLGILTMGFGLGIALGPLLAGLLGVVSFELPFLVVAGLTLGAAAVVWAKVPETAKRAR